ncbi:coatomer subunit gamma [Trichomonascus vanleenenianus]|uniref:coatomer subunit gamma n=1 Tax=Trichomonascus vanleenenianus TaxID=2268995 RepID=UPI003ECA9120
MSALTYKKNDDIESGRLDRMTVYQECISGFNASPIQTKKCRQLLSKLVHLMATGETFPPQDATALFFSITKLFQERDASLRQMVYLAVKGLSRTAEDVIMATSSIMKDVQASNEVIYKPNAIRALAHIVDASTVTSMERLMKTAIVDRHAGISSAALVASYHLIPIAKDVVRRWANETQEAVLAQKKFPQGSLDSQYAASLSTMTQYHALGLLYHLRSHDKMALMKMIQTFSSSGAQLRNSNAIVMLIRYIAKILEEDERLKPQLFPFLESWLRHKSDIVNLEAAKTILGMKGVSEAEANAAVAVLQSFLGSPRTVARFAAIRILNRFAMVRPQSVVACNMEIEALISDNSRSIATYAITTLLKTGNEASVDRLMGQIAGFMADISDEFKIIVVDAIRALALKFPNKQESMLSFLAGTLRNEGGLAFKTAVVEALFDMIRYIEASRDAALGHLCEFIEDCEYTELTVRILHLLGVEGPKTAQPTLYIRYIYNRVVLENAVIRAAAVTALAKFALVEDKAVQQSIRVLLTRCLDDITDEVRDRAALALRLIGTSQAPKFIAPKAKWSLGALEHQLALYVSGSAADLATPFDISLVPTEDEAKETARKKAAAAQVEPETKKKTDESRAMEKEMRSEQYAKQLAAIPEFAAYGPVFKSSEPVELTESETEYVVTAIKHIFNGHLVVQYDVTNTLEDMVLDNVHVEVVGDLPLEFIIPIDSLGANSTGTIYASFARDEVVATSFESVLKFVSREVDPGTGEPSPDGYDDEYSVEPLDVGAGDYIIPAYVGDFSATLESLPFALKETYQFQSAKIPEVVKATVDNLGMTALEASDDVISETSHTLKLVGRSIGKEMVAVEAKMVYSSRSGTTVQVSVKSESEAMAELVTESIGAL